MVNNVTMSYRCDVRFSSRPTGELLLDLYRPASASGAVPVIVWLHGGGWFTGDRTLELKPGRSTRDLTDEEIT